MVASKIQDPNDNSTGTEYWNYVDQELIQSGVTRMQVQAVWLKQADLAPSGSSIVYAQTLEQEIIKIVHVLSNRFPNLKLLYLSSRSYGGYATTPAINPEPYAYASGFSVKWIIEAQINGTAELNCNPEIGEVEVPWMAWEPYLWADGSIPNHTVLHGKPLTLVLQTEHIPPHRAA